MDILLICNFWHFEFEKQSSRYRTMADVLAAQPDFEVEVISSTFRHQTKKQRDVKAVTAIPTDYKVTLLREPTYRKNISIKRLYAHHRFAKEVLKYLENRRVPDVIICSVPSLSVGSVVSRFSESHGIKLIVDIQDLWPEAFKMAINIPVVSDALFAPMMLQADRIYARADIVMAVSDTYVKRGLRHNPRAKGVPLFIGTDSELVAQATAGKAVTKPTDEFWVGYAGALGHSYDICSVIDAISILEQRGYRDIVFKVMGEGVLLNEFRQYAAQKKVNCDFTGFLDYGSMMATLMQCDLAVNPIVGKSAASIINKVSDYAMAGLPVVNTQNSDEYRALLTLYDCGISCANGDAASIADAIERLHNNGQLRAQMGANARRLGDECFDRQRTYPRVVKLIGEMGG